VCLGAVEQLEELFTKNRVVVGHTLAGMRNEPAK
jgi:hypothetical protein